MKTKRLILLSILTAGMLAGLFAACSGRGSKGATDGESVEFNPHVEAFTSGRLSRTGSVFLILADEPREAFTPAQLAKMITVRPAVKGEFSIDERTILFKPADGFERGRDYTFTFDLERLVGVEGEYGSFRMGVTILPLAVRGVLTSVDVNSADENSYDILCTLTTPDVEEPATVEAIVALSESVATEWEHSPGGQTHLLKMVGVPAGVGGEREITMSVADNKLGAERVEIMKIYVPDENDFSVYDVAYVSSPEKYVEVTFNKNLGESQNLRGLAYIEGNDNETVTREGNKLRLYPDPSLSGVVTVHLNANIRSRAGLALGEDVECGVEININVPAVRFMGDGVVIPSSGDLMIPFQAVYLRGVLVKVIKVMENNMGQFLQNNALDGHDELYRVGRLVARETMFFDEEADLTAWGTYAIDLRKLIQPEQGAMYRVELSFDRNLSAYDCGDFTPKTREQIMAEDKAIFRKEASYYDTDGNYYYGDDYWWWDNNKTDPCDGSFYYSRHVARNVLATDLGVIVKSADNGKLTALVHNIVTAAPMGGVNVAVYNFQNQKLGEAVTGSGGLAEVAMPSGKAFYVIASQGKQRSYLRVDGGSALSVSDFDTSGEVVQHGIKGFIYGERGVWRPGDEIHLGFMLNDREGTIPAGYSVILELYDPFGRMYARKVASKAVMGLYAFDVPTDPDVPTGAWSARVTVGGTTFTKSLRVETVKPNRLKIDLRLPEKAVGADGLLEMPLHVEWLQGALARGLAYEIDGTLTPVQTAFDGFKDFVFDDPAKHFESEESRIAEGKLDEAGDATVRASLSTDDASPGMLAVGLSSRVFEESGDFSIDGAQITYSPYTRYAGIRSPQKDHTQLYTGQKHTFSVASVGADGKPVRGAELEVTVYKTHYHWWWDSSSGHLADYISDSSNKPVKELTLTTGAGGQVAFELSFPDEEWGTYFIHVRDSESGHTTGMMSYFDWSYGDHRETEVADAANKLTFTTDKETYAPGETVTVTIPSAAGARAIVSVESGRGVLSVTEYECSGTETTIKFAATERMQPNAYVHIMLIQPHAGTANDLPIRLYGVVPIVVTSPGSHLNPVIATADEIKPEQEYTVTVSEKSGREMAYTLAVVDEGLLDLTRFRTPDPWKAFNAREALGVRTWDMYNYVFGAYGGRIEQLFSIGGGDEAEAGKKATANRFTPVVEFAGPFHLKKGGKNKHSFAMPNYNGRVRVMVVAGDGTAYGSAERSVVVRKPLMLLGTLPRVIGVGEEMAVPATVFATQAGVGRVKVSITCSGGMEVVGAATQELRFDEPTDKQATFRVRTGAGPGVGKVTIVATGGGDKAVYETEMEIRSVRREQVKVTSMTIKAGGEWAQSVPLHGAAGTNKVTVEVSDVPPVDLAGRLNYLIGYPHGCIEQITSKGFPQLYLSQFVELSPDQRRTTEEAVKEVIRRQRSYQTGEGSLAYWPGGTQGNAWGTIYATHFMLEAEGKGYLVPADLKRGVLDNLRRVARGWKPASGNYMASEEITQSYRLYVLALAGSPEMGSMNRLREARGISPVAGWTLAAAYAQAGRGDVAREIMDRTSAAGGTWSSQYDNTYRSDVRDSAMRLIALCLVGDDMQAAELMRAMSQRLSEDGWMSTQTTGFALVALSKYLGKYSVGGDMEFGYSAAGGKTRNVTTSKHFWTQDVPVTGAGAVAVDIRNTGAGVLFGRVVVAGIPAEGTEVAYANGLRLDVRYENAAGTPVSVDNLAPGINFTAVVTVANPTARGVRNIAVTQMFPAGWEILNTRFLEGASDDTEAGVSYQDIRDDRIYSYMDYMPSGREVTFRVNLIAAYSGRFYLPPVYAEAMYDNLMRANTAGSYVTVE